MFTYTITLAPGALQTRAFGDAVRADVSVSTRTASDRNENEDAEYADADDVARAFAALDAAWQQRPFHMARALPTAAAAAQSAASGGASDARHHAASSGLHAPASTGPQSCAKAAALAGKGKWRPCVAACREAIAAFGAQPFAIAHVDVRFVFLSFCCRRSAFSKRHCVEKWERKHESQTRSLIGALDSFHRFIIQTISLHTLYSSLYEHAYSHSQTYLIAAYCLVQTGAVAEAVRMLDQPNMFNDERILEANAFSHPAVLDEVCVARA